MDIAMSVAATNQNFKFIEMPGITKPCLEWHGKIVKGFHESPKGLCDLMQKIGTVAMGILIYPTLGVIGFFSLFAQSRKMTVVEKQAIENQTLKNFDKEIDSWQPIFKKAQATDTVYYRIKVLNKEFKAKVEAQDLAKLIKDDFRTTLSAADSCKDPSWAVQLLIVRKEANGSYSMITKDKYVDKVGHSGGGEGQSKGVTQAGVDGYIKEFNK